MKIVESSVKRPVTVLMFVFIVIILGMVSLPRIPMDLLPEMEIPVAVVSTTYQGVGPQEMEELITKPLEETLGTTENLDTMTSISSEGSSMIVLSFDFGVDMNFATMDMREKIDTVKGYLPEDATEPLVFKYDPSNMPIGMFSLSSESMSHAELQTLAEDTIKPRLERTVGVASVSLLGGTENNVEIRAKSEKLQGYGIDLDYLASILSAENINLPGGSIDRGTQELTVKTNGEFTSLDEIKELLIPLPTGSIVPLIDIADVELLPKEHTSISRANGQESLDIMIMKQSGTNTVQVSRAIEKELQALHEDLPDIEINVIYDSADYIVESLNQVVYKGFTGALLAVLVLYLFLRNFRTTIIIAVSIPISIIATFCLLYFSNISFNMMTLGGLALGLGMLVDNSIVVLENIFRFRQEGSSRPDAAIKGASEVSMALIASTLTTVAVFLPIVFVEGFTSTIFKQLALTVSFSLLASLVVAITLVPMLSSKLLKVQRKRVSTSSVLEQNDNTENLSMQTEKGKARIYPFLDRIYNKFDQGFERLKVIYSRILNWSLDHKKRVLLFATVAFILCIASVSFVGAVFLPSTDEGYVTINITLPDGSKLDNTMEVVDNLESKMVTIPEVKNIFVEAGATSGSSYGGTENTATIYLELIPIDDRKSIDLIVDDVRNLVKDTPKAEITISQMSMMSMGLSGDPINISIYGQDLDTLKQIGDDFVNIVETVEGTREVTSSYSDGIPEIIINVDRSLAAQYGLTAGQIAQIVNSGLSGKTATSFRYDGTEIDVRIKGDNQYNQSIDDLKQLPINTGLGFSVALGQIADISMERGPVSINRTDRERVITITGKISSRDLASVSADIEDQLSDYLMPDQYYYKIGGEQEEMVDAFSDLFLAMILAIILVYMVMASQFESLLYPFIIMFSLPLAIAGGIFGLFIYGQPLSIVSLIGIIMLVGIAVNNAIVLVDYINTRRRIYGEDVRTAITKAGPTRLRPVLMTMLTTVLGMLPISMGIGEGSELAAPLAIVVVVGLTLSTLVTLVVIPVLYAIFDSLSNRFWNKIKGRKSKVVKDIL